MAASDHDAVDGVVRISGSFQLERDGSGDASGRTLSSGSVAYDAPGLCGALRRLDAACCRGNIIVRVCLFILVTELCERLAYYGLTGSLTIFFTKELGMRSFFATCLTSLFSSLNYITPLLGAWVADGFCGRYRTIGLFGVVYIAGLALCIVGAHPAVKSSWIFLVGLFIGVAVGAGGIKPNVVVFGADQFDTRIPAQVKQKEQFFGFFYWCINIGATVAYAYLAQLAVNGQPAIGIPVEYGFFASFIVPGVAMCLGFALFFAGTPRYQMKKPEGSAFVRFLKIVLHAALRSWQGRFLLLSCASLFLGMLVVVCGYFIDPADPTLRVAHLIFAITGMVLILAGLVAIVIFSRRVDFLERASTEHGTLGHRLFSPDCFNTVTFHASCSHNLKILDSLPRTSLTRYVRTGGAYAPEHVAGAQSVVGLFPYLAFLCIFWACYGQLNTNFLLQGCQMDLRWFGNVAPAPSWWALGPQVSVSFLNLFDTIVILAVIPLLQLVLCPLLHWDPCWCCYGGAATRLFELGAAIDDRCPRWCPTAANAAKAPADAAGKGEAEARRQRRAPLQRGRTVSMMQKIGCGFIACTLSLLAGGLVELARKDAPLLVLDPATDAISNCDDPTDDTSTVRMRDLSIWWLAIQFTLIGVAEVLTAVTSYDLFYSQVPSSMRSVCQALNLLTTSIGAMVTGGINSMFSDFIPDDLDKGHLEYVFFFVAALTFITMCGFFVVSYGFVGEDDVALLAAEGDDGAGSGGGAESGANGFRTGDEGSLTESLRGGSGSESESGGNRSHTASMSERINDLTVRVGRTIAIANGGGGFTPLRGD